MRMPRKTLLGIAVVGTFFVFGHPASAESLKVYTNKTFHYSIAFPKTWVVENDPLIEGVTAGGFDSNLNVRIMYVIPHAIAKEDRAAAASDPVAYLKLQLGVHKAPGISVRTSSVHKQRTVIGTMVAPALASGWVRTTVFIFTDVAYYQIDYVSTTAALKHFRKTLDAIIESFTLEPSAWRAFVSKPYRNSKTGVSVLLPYAWEVQKSEKGTLFYAERNLSGFQVFSPQTLATAKEKADEQKSIAHPSLEDAADFCQLLTVQSFCKLRGVAKSYVGKYPAAIVDLRSVESGIDHLYRFVVFIQGDREYLITLVTPYVSYQLVKEDFAQLLRTLVVR
jgi:hypothetical protein